MAQTADGSGGEEEGRGSGGEEDSGEEEEERRGEAGARDDAEISVPRVVEGVAHGGQLAAQDGVAAVRVNTEVEGRVAVKQASVERLAEARRRSES